MSIQPIIPNPLNDWLQAQLGRSPSRGSLFDQLVEGIRAGIETGADNATIRETTNRILLLYFGVGSAISIADVGSDLFDFSVGRSLSQIVHPLISRAILQPMDDILKKAYRWDGPNTRMIVSMIEAGALTEDAAHAMLVDAEIKDEYLPYLKGYARQKRAAVVLAAADKAAKAKVDLEAAATDPVSARATREVAQLETMIDAGEINQVVLPLQRQKRIVDGLAGLIDRTIDHALYDPAPANEKAIEELQRILSIPPPEYPGTPQLPPAVAVSWAPDTSTPPEDFTI